MDGAPATPRTLVSTSGLSRLETLALLQHVSAQPREWWVARETDPFDRHLSESQQALLYALIRRRVAGEPLAYLVGTCEFYGRRFYVTPATLIPRADTELLVDVALAAIDTLQTHAIQPIEVLDLGTGTGCIAISLAAERPACRIVATERSPAALEVARRNAKTLLGSDALLELVQAQDWFAWGVDADQGVASAPAKPSRVDLIVSNPPYIAANDPHLEQGDLRFEPRSALTDESAGLHSIEAILAGAVAAFGMRPLILLEHGWDQGLLSRRLAAKYGWEYTTTLCDSQGLPRVLLASTSAALFQALASQFTN